MEGGVKHDPNITLSVSPWDLPAVEMAKQVDDTPDQGALSPLSTGPKSPASALVGRMFLGRLNVSDLDYMAKAILQMADENYELRERVRRLEERADRSGQA